MAIQFFSEIDGPSRHAEVIQLQTNVPKKPVSEIRAVR